MIISDGNDPDRSMCFKLDFLRKMLLILSDLALNAALQPLAGRIAFAFLLNAVLVRLKRDHQEVASTS
jgi:hypothetical protein